MSIALMSRVMDAPLGNSTDKLVLLVLADYANNDGENVFPSIATVARRCDLSDRTVQLSLKRMAGKKWISAAGQVRVSNGTVTRYRIHAKNLPAMTGESGSPVKDVHPTGEGRSPLPVKDVHPTGEGRSPNPSLNHQKITISEPSVGEGARKFDADAAARAAGIDKQPHPPRKSKKVEPPKAPTITAEQLQHFAVSAHREIVGVLLDAFCIEQIIARVTDEVDWRECLTDWRLHTNWRTDNIAGQLDRYARWGEIKAQAANAPSLKRSEPINGARAGTLTGAAKIAQETFERQMDGIQCAVEAAMAGGWHGNA